MGETPMSRRAPFDFRESRCSKIVLRGRSIDKAPTAMTTAASDNTGVTDVGRPLAGKREARGKQSRGLLDYSFFRVCPGRFPPLVGIGLAAVVAALVAGVLAGVLGAGAGHW